MDQTTALAPRDRFRGLLEKNAEAIETAVGAGMNLEKVQKQVLMAADNNPRLMECSPGSLIKAVCGAASLGLNMSGGPATQAHLVPYYNKKARVYEAQLIIDWKGYADAIWRSGKVEHLDTQVVYENDHFEIELGLSPDLRHTPASGDRGVWVGAYAVCVLKGSSRPLIEWMDKASILKIRARSQNQGGPWSTDTEEMARKSPLKRLQKRIPWAPDLADILEMDDDVLTVVAEEVTKKRVTPKTSALRERLALPEEAEAAETLSGEVCKEISETVLAAGLDPGEWGEELGKAFGTDILGDIPAEDEGLVRKVVLRMIEEAKA